MPRQARTHSESGYMHLIAKGNGSLILFEDRDDYAFYLSLLRKFAAETGIDILAYCLMDNHVHLLVRDKGRNVSLFIQKLNGTYTARFNEKYERSGHLFQDRFKSENVEDEAYLMTVFRYILNNPQKARICPAPEYEWSSYKDYGNPDSFVRTGVFWELMGDIKEYTAYIAAKNDDECMEYETVVKNDDWALDVIRKTLGVESGTVLQNWDRERRNAALKLLKEKGIRIRQIERLTGINRGVIQKA